VSAYVVLEPAMVCRVGIRGGSAALHVKLTRAKWLELREKSPALVAPQRFERCCAGARASPLLLGLISS